MAKRKKITGQIEQFTGILEIDKNRGVVYFHDNNTGSTLLRICKLPIPIPTDRLLDITIGWGCSWGKEKDIKKKEK